MFLSLMMTLSMATGEGPMGAALAAAEAPATLRAAFTVELSSPAARQVYSYDPRRPAPDRWQLVSRQGEDVELDRVAGNWAAEAAPDSRLFPDDLRASLGQRVDVDTSGGAWRIAFRHTPNHNDTELDRWAAERLKAVAWLDPVAERFVRIDYTLPRPVSGPEGGRLTRYNQTYLLATEPRWGFTYVNGFSISLEARAAFQRIERRYEVRVTDVYFFFASVPAEDAFYASRTPAPPMLDVLPDEDAGNPSALR